MSNRLSKVLASAGVASRRAAEELIFSGRVKVNGQTVNVPQTLVSLEKDLVEVNGERIAASEQKLYFLLNKPEGYLCTSVRPGTMRIVLDLFPGLPERLFTVGRLDKDTSGLLIVTNDGHFANRLIHPSSRIAKEYLVKCRQEIAAPHLETLSEGARVDEKWVKPLSVTKVRRGTFKIVVKEGKKHEVRILCERAGLKIETLHRIRIGGLSLGSLQAGEWRPLTEQERSVLFTPYS
jgi:23S rRNA pseudouridine2605 synthase